LRSIEVVIIDIFFITCIWSWRWNIYALY